MRLPKKRPYSPRRLAVISGAFGLGILLSGLAVYAFPSDFEYPPNQFDTTIDIKNKEIAEPPAKETPRGWARLKTNFGKLAGLVADSAFYNNLASPSQEYISVPSGMRKEEIAELFAKKLDWSEEEKNSFLDYVSNIRDLEGRLHPGTYALPAKRDWLSIKHMLTERFGREVTSRYTTLSVQEIPLDTTLAIASILEREAANKKDMHLISGILWNRIFRDMKLQIDATLQYAKGNEELGWWPRVSPEDKYIESPYNTYKYEGLPPTPISNPSLTAIMAALNPKKTDCLYYYHDRFRRNHCAKTYKEHLANIRRY